MSAFTLLLAGLALVGVVFGIRNLFTDGYRRVPTRSSVRAR